MLFGRRCCYQYYRLYPQPKRTNGLSHKISRRLSRLNLLSPFQASPNSSSKAKRTLVNTINLFNITMDPVRKNDLGIINLLASKLGQSLHCTNNKANANLKIKDDVINDSIKVGHNDVSFNREEQEDQSDSTGSHVEEKKKNIEDLLFGKFSIGRTTSIGFNNGFWTGLWGGVKDTKAILSDAQLYNNSGNSVGSSQSIVKIPINHITYVV